MTTIPAADLVREYQRVALAAGGANGAGRMTTFGWDLEYTAPDAVLAFIDQILFRRMNDFLPEHDAPVILDCGANIGYTSLHYKRRWPAARIIAFEPDPQFAPILRRNLARNGAADVDVVEAAAWTGDGRARWLMEGKDGSRLLRGAAPAAAVVDVATVDLARYLDQDVDLLKLDVEGAEFELVPHLAPHLGRVKNILVECHIGGQAHYAALSALLDTLTRAGFTISLNSYGPWRDLTRRHAPGPLHSEQYLLVAGWRAEQPGVAREAAFTPYAGIPHDLEQGRALRADADHVSRALGGLVTSPELWRVLEMRGPFRHDTGSCWTWRAPEPLPAGDSLDASDTPTIVFEDGRVLGPAHALHADIRALGSGRFSHWESRIYFSASDNSDPNTNGRRYTVLHATTLPR